jgi:hypothetical protein
MNVIENVKKKRRNKTRKLRNVDHIKILKKKYKNKKGRKKILNDENAERKNIERVKISKKN